MWSDVPTELDCSAFVADWSHRWAAPCVSEVLTYNYWLSSRLWSWIPGAPGGPALSTSPWPGALYMASVVVALVAVVARLGWFAADRKRQVAEES